MDESLKDQPPPAEAPVQQSPAKQEGPERQEGPEKPPRVAPPASETPGLSG
jgi:hypothetical protein